MGNNKKDDDEKDRKNDKRKKSLKKYRTPVLVQSGTLSVSKVAFASTNT
ncbi:MAG: hypothetical protein ACHQ2Z_10665 [Elusimicrobiota bacterium]